MTWKEKVKRVCAIDDVKVRGYLERMGFEESVMSPTYTNKGSHKHLVKSLEEPCMRLDTEKRGTDNQIIIFINSEEAYLEEIEDTFKRSSYVEIKEGLTVENIDDILNKLMGE